MTFSNVFNYIKNGQAASCGTMLGYFSREDQPRTVDKSGREGKSVGQTYDRIVTDKAWFSFVENKDVKPDGDPATGTDSVTDYVFVRTTVTTYSVTVAAEERDDVVDESSAVVSVTWQNPNLGTSVQAYQPLVLDYNLLQYLASSDWEIVDLAVAKARKGNNARW